MMRVAAARVAGARRALAQRGLSVAVDPSPAAATAAATAADTASSSSSAPPFVADCTFVGIKSTVATPDLRVHAPDDYPVFPVFRLLLPDGTPAPGAVLPQLEPATWVSMYRKMCELQTMDTIFYNSQRQGRISFYMTCSGEEAAGIGSAAALQPEDTIVAQYRELGVFTWRGFTIQNVADQLFSNEAGHGKGRQMPMHIGSKAHNIQTISSPLGQRRGGDGQRQETGQPASQWGEGTSCT